MRRRSIATALSVLKNQGVRQVLAVLGEKAGMWWRHGEPLEWRKFVGQPSDIAILEGCRFGLDAAGVSEDLRYLLLTGKHELPERTLVRRHLNPDLPVVEFGAAIGVVSCIANKLLNHQERHIVVEANPALVPILLNNRDRNGCRFTVLHRAVAYGCPVVSFHLNSNVLASSVHVPVGHTVEVAATNLQQILEEQGFERCTLICDIEGGEADLVRHESSTLSKHVETLIIEVHEHLIGSEHDVMFRALERAGFRAVERMHDSVVFRNTRGCRSL